MLEALQILVAIINFYNTKNKPLALLDRFDERTFKDLGMKKAYILGRFAWPAYGLHIYSRVGDTIQIWRICQADLVRKPASSSPRFAS